MESTVHGGEFLSNGVDCAVGGPVIDDNDPATVIGSRGKGPETLQEHFFAVPCDNDDGNKRLGVRARGWHASGRRQQVRDAGAGDFIDDRNAGEETCTDRFQPESDMVGPDQICLLRVDPEAILCCNRLKPVHAHFQPRKLLHFVDESGRFMGKPRDELRNRERYQVEEREPGQTARAKAAGVPRKRRNKAGT